jgi:hypothetical protein
VARVEDTKMGSREAKSKRPLSYAVAESIQDSRKKNMLYSRRDEDYHPTSDSDRYARIPSPSEKIH